MILFRIPTKGQALGSCWKGENLLRALITVSYVLLVNNFQNIRNDFNLQVKEQIALKEKTEVKAQLAEELDKHDQLHQKSRYFKKFTIKLLFLRTGLTFSKIVHE